MRKRVIEVFSAGCACCNNAIQAVHDASCESCDVRILDMKDPAVAAREKQVGIHRVPAVVIDGQLADCCATGEVDLDVMRSMSLGVA